MDGLTIEQQRKAVNYSVCFLRDEVESLRNTIKQNVFWNLKHQLEQRLFELEADLEVFEKLNDELSI